MSQYLPKAKNETRLEKHVRCWINNQVTQEYEWKTVVGDVFYGGCESGIVTHLIYNSDCLKFAQKYLEEICELIADYEENYESLPFKKGNFTAVNLAWIGFELTVTKIALENGYYD